jgi:(2Fe-2S) ferredoxin
VGGTEHIFVCDNVDCRMKGSLKVQESLEARIDEEGLDIEVTSYTCFSGCQIGPNVALLPEGVWYAGVDVADVEEIVERHLKAGETVDRLTKDVDEPAKRMIMAVLESGGWGSVY